MLTKTRSTPVPSPAPGVIPDRITGPVSNRSPLATSNTAHVNWVFGSSHVSLVWLVLFAAILGWLLGLVATAAVHWRTRAPRRQHGAPS
jgi:hypothetical protein